MLPIDLKPDDFRAYTPRVKKLAIDHLDALKRFPISFLPNLLRDIIASDWKVPAERKQLEDEILNIVSLSAEQNTDWFEKVARISVSESLTGLDWLNAPGEFVEQLSSYLWTTHQLDAFREAAVIYADRLHAALPHAPPVVPRLGIAVIGQGLERNDYPLFRKLRPHGVYFTHVNPDDGLQELLNALAKGASKYRTSYGHWYIDGGQPHPHPHNEALTSIADGSLSPARAALLRKMQAEIQKQGMWPEALRTILARMKPEDLSLQEGYALLNGLCVSLLTEGSGTQIFSTTFVQWAARETLRRAQPLRLLVRFAPRQRQKPMNELLSNAHHDAENDPLGSLIDADMGAYYSWLGQHRLSGAQRSSFLVWFENHSEALAISPTLPRGTQSSKATSVSELLQWIG